MRSLNVISAERVIAALIEAGEIQSINYNPAGTPPYSAAGTRIDLLTGAINTPNLNIDAAGNLSLTGSVVGGNVQSANYDAPDVGETFADAGTRINLANGDITSTALAVNGATGALAIRGDVTAATFTALGPVGSNRTLTAAQVTGISPVVAAQSLGLKFGFSGWTDPDVGVAIFGEGAATSNFARVGAITHGAAADQYAGLIGDTAGATASASVQAAGTGGRQAYVGADVTNSGQAGATLSANDGTDFAQVRASANGGFTSLTLTADQISAAALLTPADGTGTAVSGVTWGANIDPADSVIWHIRLGEFDFYRFELVPTAGIAPFATLATLPAGRRPAGVAALGLWRNGTTGANGCSFVVVGGQVSIDNTCTAGQLVAGIAYGM